ncbi:trypsin, alkaline C-like [Spodoptera litura]|uniref:Trypsin, alkaline C-like n=1 Tax=Spodoptera litura TaxID=69820 RepID=A0A9J7EQ23_SPOLT|nr:trypsin, alkaline C-like [Spodoptera litura]
MWCRILLFVAVIGLGHGEIDNLLPLRQPPSENRVIGGEPTTIEKYPFVVQIIRYQFGGKYVLGCGGSLVTKRYVLSAANCFVFSSDCYSNFTTTSIPGTKSTEKTETTENTKRTRKTRKTTKRPFRNGTQFWWSTHASDKPKARQRLVKRSGLYIDPAEYRIRVGSTGVRDSGGIRYEVTAIIVHENFSRYDNDIALVRTRNPIPLGRTIAIINIPQEEVMMPDNAAVTVIGWGSASLQGSADLDVLHEVSIKLVDWETCKNIYSNKHTNITITGNMICAGSLKAEDKGVCTSDVGSPLLYEDKLVGLASWFQSCRDKKYPDVYTRISSYTTWINNVVKMYPLRSELHPGRSPGSSPSSMNKIEDMLLISFLLYSVLSA